MAAHQRLNRVHVDKRGGPRRAARTFLHRCVVTGAFAVLGASNVAAQPALRERLRDAEYRTACGPIACYLAIRSVGQETTLAQVIAGCGWSEGKYTTLRAMRDVILAHGLSCQAVRLSPSRLADLLRHTRGAAVIPVRKRSATTDHAVCATDADGDFIWAAEYPELGRWVHVDELAEIWNGEALFVEANAKRGIREFIMAVVPGACGGFCAVLLFARVRKWRGRDPASLSVPSEESIGS